MMRDTVVVCDDYACGKSPAGSSFVRTLLCGAPLFLDPRRRPSSKMKSTQFCNYTALPTCFKQDEKETDTQQSSGTANYKNQPSASVAKYQDCFCESDGVQQYYEKLMCQLTMSNSALMHENQRYQIRFKHLRMLLENHVDHLNNIYFTLFLNGFHAVQFPDGQTVNLAEFQGTELKLIPRVCRLKVDISPSTPDEDLFASFSHNNNGSFADISAVTRSSSEEAADSEQNSDNLQSKTGESSRSIFSSSDDDIEGYLKWLNGQTTDR